MQLSTDPIGIVSTSIGELEVFPINMRDLMELDRRGFSRVNETKPVIYVKELTRQIAHKKAESENAPRPKQPTLTETDVANLSDADLNKIAECYISGDEWVFPDTAGSDKSAKPERGKSESSIDYLHRLLSLQNEALVDMGKGFSVAAKAKIGGALSFGKKLTTLLGGSDGTNISDYIIAPVPQPRIDWEEFHRLKEDETNRPFDRLADKLGQKMDNLTETQRLSIEFLEQINISQTSVASELKQSSDGAEKWARKAYWIGVSSILIAVVTGFGQIWIALETPKLDQQIKPLTESIDRVITKIEIASIATSGAATQIVGALEQLRATQFQLEELKSRIDDLEHTVQQREKEVKILRDAQLKKDNTANPKGAKSSKN